MEELSKPNMLECLDLYISNQCWKTNTFLMKETLCVSLGYNCGSLVIGLCVLVVPGQILHLTFFLKLFSIKVKRCSGGHLKYKIPQNVNQDYHHIEDPVTYLII